MGDKRFYVPVLTVLALAAVVVLVRGLSGLPEDWLEYVCKSDDCTVQAWLSATAGWVGFGAAAIGAYFVFGQLSEQRRQTAFMLGDGEPTFDIISGSNSKWSCRFKLINWNRRTVVLASIRFVAPADVPIPVKFVRYSDAGKAMTPIGIHRKGRPETLPALNGWEDRQKPPETLVFAVAFDDSVAPDDIPIAYRDLVTVEFSYFVPSNHSPVYRKHRITGIRGNVLPKSKAWKAQQER